MSVLVVKVGKRSLSKDRAEPAVTAGLHRDLCQFLSSRIWRWDLVLWLLLTSQLSLQVPVLLLLTSQDLESFSMCSFS